MLRKESFRHILSVKLKRTIITSNTREPLYEADSVSNRLITVIIERKNRALYGHPVITNFSLIWDISFSDYDKQAQFI